MNFKLLFILCICLKTVTALKNPLNDLLLTVGIREIVDRKVTRYCYTDILSLKYFSNLHCLTVFAVAQAKIYRKLEKDISVIFLLSRVNFLFCSVRVCVICLDCLIAFRARRAR